jgi:alpha-mannosidase
MSRKPLLYTFGNHVHFAGHQWMRGEEVVAASIRDMLALADGLKLRGNLDCDAAGLERLAFEWPEVFAELREAVQAGRIELVSTSYGQPCGLFHGGESNVRQRVAGAHVARRLLGVWPRAHWSAELDFFPQLPQILAGIGVESASLSYQWSRNTPELPEEPSAIVLWEGLDGTRLLALPNNELSLQQWNEEFQSVLTRRLAREAQLVAVRQWFELQPLSSGLCSSESMGATLAKFLSDERYELRACTLSEMTAQLREAAKELPVVRYTLDEAWHGTTAAKNGDYVTRYSRTAEEQVLAAERVASLAGLFGPPYAGLRVYPHWELDECWRDLLTAQHHEVHSGEGECGAYGERLFERAIATGGEIFARTLEHIGRRVAAPEGSTILFNTLGWTRDIAHDNGVAKAVPPYGYAVIDPYDELEEPPLGRISMHEDERELVLSRGSFEVRIDRESGLVRQVHSRDWPDGVFAAGKPFGGLEMRRNRALERFSTVNVSSAPDGQEFAEFVFLREGRGGSRVRITYSMSMVHDSLWVRLQGENIAQPDPGLNNALALTIAPRFAPHRVFHDHPYGTSEVRAEGVRVRKYPTGDPYGSPQVFEEIRGPFTSSSFVDLIEEGERGRGLLVIHDGCQQFQREARGVRALLHASDPWDGAHYDNVFDAELWLVPHGGLRPSERVRLATECNLGSPRFDPFATAGGGGELPKSLGALSLESEHVLCTALYRESQRAAAGLDEAFAAEVADSFVIRLVEYDGRAGEALLKLPGPIARAAKTDLLGRILEPLHARSTSAPFGPAELPWSALRVPLRPHEIATVRVDLEFGREVPIDLRAQRASWVAARRRPRPGAL